MAVSLMNPDRPGLSPALWVIAAERIGFTCRRCAGTGSYITGSLNGKPTGPGGICFRCQGKGQQTYQDILRNRTHDKHAFARAAQAMMGG